MKKVIAVAADTVTKVEIEANLKIPKIIMHLKAHGPQVPR
jgi:hypothetical protein